MPVTGWPGPEWSVQWAEDDGWYVLGPLPGWDKPDALHLRHRTVAEATPVLGWFRAQDPAAAAA